MIDSKRTADTFSEKLVQFKKMLDAQKMTGDQAQALKSKIEAHLKK